MNSGMQRFSIDDIRAIRSEDDARRRHMDAKELADDVRESAKESHSIIRKMNENI